MNADVAKLGSTIKLEVNECGESSNLGVGGGQDLDFFLPTLFTLPSSSLSFSCHLVKFSVIHYNNLDLAG